MSRVLPENIFLALREYATIDSISDGWEGAKAAHGLPAGRGVRGCFTSDSERGSTSVREGRESMSRFHFEKGVWSRRIGGLFFAGLAFAMLVPTDAEAYYTPFVSEENPPAICRSRHLVGGMLCRGSYCDNVALDCSSVSGLKLDYTFWTNQFSEERGGKQMCERGFVTGVQCFGRYCDNKSLQCTVFENVSPRNCSWTGWVSEEHGGRIDFPRGYYMHGAQCAGRYCDNMRFLICQAR